MTKLFRRVLFVSIMAVIMLMVIGFSQIAIQSNESASDNQTPAVLAPDTEEQKPALTQDAQSEEDEQKALSEEVLKAHQREAAKQDDTKTVYLTFDDGPSPKVTPQILAILKQYDIKATFFVIGQMVELHPQIAKQVREEGHLLCNHSYSHRYKTLYSTPDNFMADIEKCDSILQTALGEGFSTKIIRFPAGSLEKEKQPYKDRVIAEGYHYIDWNALSGDAEGRNASVEDLIARVKETCAGKNTAVVLMHDSNTKKNTVEALPGIIEYLQAQGYTFKTLESYPF